MAFASYLQSLPPLDFIIERREEENEGLGSIGKECNIVKHLFWMRVLKGLRNYDYLLCCLLGDVDAPLEMPLCHLATLKHSSTQEIHNGNHS